MVVSNTVCWVGKSVCRSRSGRSLLGPESIKKPQRCECSNRRFTMIWGYGARGCFHWNYNFIFPIHSKCISCNLCYFEPGSSTLFGDLLVPTDFQERTFKGICTFTDTLPGTTKFPRKRFDSCTWASCKLSLEKKKKWKSKVKSKILWFL